MPLGTGTRIGPYEVLSALGAGGMGEVYRARDTQLNRDVAVKILPEAFALDPERVARFKREAQVVAALNHPHIAAIYGFDESAHALILELVEGPTLADRIARGPIPVDEALGIASQIVDALDAAHERGIVHRDLKPANVKVRDDGTVKVLDFGLAKAMEAGEAITADVSASPTISIAATGVGVILGTAAYMAPEQARGKAVDRRADIWAFGCVVYEMLTSRRAFDGEEASDVMAAILRSEPDLSLVPEELRALIRACLQKDRARRLQSIADYRLLVTEHRPFPVGTARPIGWMIATAVAITAAIASGIGYLRQEPMVEPLRHFSLAVPDRTLIGYVALSPDGRRVATAEKPEASFDLWVYDLENGTHSTVKGAEDVRGPFWSADARSIGFFSQGKLKTIPATGGAARALCDETADAGGTWGKDNVIIYGASGSLWRVSADGGPCTVVLAGKTPTGGYGLPTFLPDYQHFTYVDRSSDPARAGLYIAALDDLPGRRVLADVTSASFVPDRQGATRGALLFVRNGNLMSQAFDVRSASVSGDAATVARDVSFTLTGGQISAANAADGTLVYVSQPPRQYQTAWYDRTGQRQITLANSAGANAVALSRDEQRLAVVVGSGQTTAIAIHDLRRDIQTPFARPGYAPVWAPSGSHIAFAADDDDLYVQDAGGGQRIVVVHNAHAKRPSDWSADGNVIVFTEDDPSTQSDIWAVNNPLEGDQNTAKPVIRTFARETQGKLSSDSRWIAYTSDESGQLEVYVRPFPSGSGKWRISAGGGREATWRRDGKELFYAEPRGNGYRIVAVPIVAAADGLQPGQPMPLFDFAAVGTAVQNNVYMYAPSADGSRFLVRAQLTGTQQELHVVTHWRPTAAADR